MREEEPNMNYVWHFVKKNKKRLLAASKITSCKILKKWIKSICNPFLWACTTCEGDTKLL